MIETPNHGSSVQNTRIILYYESLRSVLSDGGGGFKGGKPVECLRVDLHKGRGLWTATAEGVNCNGPYWLRAMPFSQVQYTQSQDKHTEAVNVWLFFPNTQHITKIQPNKLYI